ncbi:hypothetical protein E4T56_gene1984 [Termitomyces sp. T112]|nr:hypothetical protein E4T56_gene1984 [Termitomyces sp. T112]
MVYIQARLAALLGLCLLASTASALPNDSKASLVIRRQFPDALTGFLTTFNQKGDNKGKTSESTPEAKGKDSTTTENKANSRNDEGKSATTKDTATKANDKNSTAKKDSAASENTGSANENTEPAENQTEQPTPRRTPTRRSTFGPNSYVRLSKRDFSRHSHSSGSHRSGYKSRPVYRHANRYRHGHKHHRKPVNHHHRQHNNGGYSASF